MHSQTFTENEVKCYLAGCEDTKQTFNKWREHRTAMRAVQKHIKTVRKDFTTCQLKGVFVKKKRNRFPFWGLLAIFLAPIFFSMIVEAPAQRVDEAMQENSSLRYTSPEQLGDFQFFDPCDGHDCLTPEEQ